jgi:hypothetical protein
VDGDPPKHLAEQLFPREARAHVGPPRVDVNTRFAFLERQRAQRSKYLGETIGRDAIYLIQSIGLSISVLEHEPRR